MSSRHLQKRAERSTLARRPDAGFLGRRALADLRDHALTATVIPGRLVTHRHERELSSNNDPSNELPGSCPSQVAKSGLVRVTAARKGHPEPKGSTGRTSDEVAKIDSLIVGRRLSLTPAEARVASALTEGLSYNEIAERLGLSYHTVHTHVKAIHIKAGVATNGRLLALLRKMEED